MDKFFLIQLTSELYQLTLLFPKKEPLRYKMREFADEILANQTEKDLEILDSFFEIAKAQNWVSLEKMLRIQKEYDKIKAEIKKIENCSSELPGLLISEKSSKEKPEAYPLQVSNSRHEKILEFLKEKGKAQVWEVKQILPEVTKRTLRRDFESLLKKGIIERKGEKNNTFYELLNPAKSEKA